MIGRAANTLVAALVAAGVLYLCAAGAGPLPPLGPAFNPGRGVWTSAADAESPHAETLHLDGLRGSVRVIFEKNGVAHIVAANDLDAFLALGYVEARYRLFQMDLERRQGEGRLAEVFGPAALDTDRFELQLGLARTAKLEWLQMDSATRALLDAYATGVNDRITEDRGGAGFPMLFSLSGYEPEGWSPLDSLVVKGDMTQDLDYQTTPLNYALLVKSLGYQRTMDWLPLLPPNEQHPYDAGPYRHDAPAPIEQMAELTTGQVASLKTLRDRLAALPEGIVAKGGNSNNWAVDGTKSASGKPMLAGDPHLHLTLPSVWFQVSVDSPSYHFAGVGIPGTPGIIIGHNQHIAWSLTDTQSAVTYYYAEKTDGAHPDEYFWNGAWRHFQHVHYTIGVKGRSPEALDVKISVHGPVITQQGETFSVWWAGALPSQDLTVLSNVVRASNWSEFTGALRGWYAPTHNFVYADDAGNIGLIAPGYYPIVRSGQPWLPLSGTGESDVIGAVPYADVPRVYDPPEHFTFSANQRPVAASYPYYIGTATNDFDPGYRANEIHLYLSTHDNVSAADMAALQADNRDFLAAEIVPRLIDAIGPTGSPAVGYLKGWDFRMTSDSTAASIWWFFWNNYLNDTFGPWWRAGHVKANLEDVRDGLSQSLENWTVKDPTNAAFTPPDSPPRTAQQVMRLAFSQAYDSLAGRFGSDPSKWTWGRVHQRELQSLALISSLNYGPFGSSGDNRTPNAAGGSLESGTIVSDHGPSWRMIVDWGGAAQGVYPGGQSENPASAWYENRVGTWWDGRYDLMLSADTAAGRSGSVTWDLQP